MKNDYLLVSRQLEKSVLNYAIKQQPSRGEQTRVGNFTVTAVLRGEAKFGPQICK